MALMQRAGFGPGGSTVLEVGAVETLPEPEMLLAIESLIPPELRDTPISDERDPLARTEDTVVDVSPELAWLSERDRVDQTSAARPSSAQGASFFGALADGDQFVYVVDISSSMNIGWGKRASEVSRLVRVMAELKASIERLSPDQSFYVILFNGETRRMFDDAATVPRTVPATPENKRRLNDWLAAVRTGEATDPRRALELGMGMRPSALFLLSDGVFYGPAATVLEIIERHSQGDTPIHTIAYEDPRSSKAMEQIARLTGGEFQFVPSPSVAHLEGQIKGK